jgi:hypothetical protein
MLAMKDKIIEIKVRQTPLDRWGGVEYVRSSLYPDQDRL